MNVSLTEPKVKRAQTTDMSDRGVARVSEASEASEGATVDRGKDRFWNKS